MLRVARVRRAAVHPAVRARVEPAERVLLHRRVRAAAAARVAVAYRTPIARRRRRFATYPKPIASNAFKRAIAH